MKTFGVVSYNIHCNFTNYGSALQSWALCRTMGSALMVFHFSKTTMNKKTTGGKNGSYKS